MKTKITMLLALMALGSSAFLANAQDNNDGPPTNAPAQHDFDGGNGHARPHGQGGFHLLPPRAQEQLKLTDDQKAQVAALEAETKAKLEKILTPEQVTQLKNMRPPMRRGSPDGQGQNFGGGDRPDGPPPGDDNGGNNAPPGPPPGDN